MHPLLMDPKSMNYPFEFNPDLLLNFNNDIKNDELFQTNNSVNSCDSNCNSNNSSVSCESIEIPDFSDACLKFISDILLEEDLEETPASILEVKALKATEKSLYDVLNDESFEDEGLDSSFCNLKVENFSNANWGLSSSQTPDDGNGLSMARPLLDLMNSMSSGSSNSLDDSKDEAATSPDTELSSAALLQRRKKSHERDERNVDEKRSNKHQASFNEDYVEMEQYDDVLLCKEDKGDHGKTFGDEKLNRISERLQKRGVKGRGNRGKKQYNEVEEVDLRTLLSHCAQAVSSFDLRSANEILKQIRQHSTPYGDSLQRVAHHFANGFEARLAGTGSTISSDVVDARMSSSDFLKAYKVYVSAVPFKRMSYYLANNVIVKLAEKATRIHIIDFGIFLGLQWPCFIQNLSRRSTGPPRLRITGIDYPQRGFRPSERVDATGKCLAGYCDRFNVPFIYEGIAKKWENIQLEDLKIDNDELLIVNCMYRSGTLLDETVETNSPRDAFLSLIKKIKPDLFIHGVINGTYNAPFFITRFREALFHYSSMFDVFEATIPREDHARMLIETEIYGKETLNVIACEGAERIQRPETYKQWQVRSARAGLRQIPLDGELMSKAKAKVKANYHKDFVVDEDRHWMLQGWKGRICSALSFWQSK